MADAQFVTGYSSASKRSAAREGVTYILFLLFLIALLFGAHVVAVVWG